MLKRQRQPSPPPPSAPFLSADPLMPVPELEDLDRQRHAKRRRTQPPVLDGTLRGWARVETEDDGEEEVVEEEVGWSNLDENTTISEEYKSTNSILRDLHALHQHRVSFSSMTPSTRPVLPDSSTHPTSASHLVSSHLSLPSKRHPALTHPHLHAGPHMGTLSQSSMHKTMGQGQAQIVDEAGVSEHYENINRYFYISHHHREFHLLILLTRILGSLFLSRRRALDPFLSNASQS